VGQHRVAKIRVVIGFRDYLAMSTVQLSLNYSVRIWRSRRIWEHRLMKKAKVCRDRFAGASRIEDVYYIIAFVLC
jgi:hypothetical protein